jgi:hypothetical protein
MQRLFVDTSAWLAFANRKDPDHGAVRGVFDGFQGRLTTSNFVFDETVSLGRYRLVHNAAERVGGVLLDRNTVDLIRISPEDEKAAWTLFRNRRPAIQLYRLHLLHSHAPLGHHRRPGPGRRLSSRGVCGRPLNTPRGTRVGLGRSTGPHRVQRLPFDAVSFPLGRLRA